MMMMMMMITIMTDEDDGNDDNVKYTTAALDNLINQNQNLSPNQALKMVTWDLGASKRLAHNTTKNTNFKYDITLQ
jgi:hypothetical protein